MDCKIFTAVEVLAVNPSKLCFLLMSDIFTLDFCPKLFSPSIFHAIYLFTYRVACKPPTVTNTNYSHRFLFNIQISPLFFLHHILKTKLIIFCFTKYKRGVCSPMPSQEELNIYNVWRWEATCRIYEQERKQEYNEKTVCASEKKEWRQGTRSNGILYDCFMSSGLCFLFSKSLA